MLSNKQGKKLNAYVSDYVVFDLETTGISWKNDDIIEISAVKVKNGEIIDEFSSLVNPMRSIPQNASIVNGIYDDMVKDSPVFEVVFKDFLEFIGDNILVGHNIHNFDMKFLYRESQKFWGMTINNDYVDTLPYSRTCLPELSNHKLTDLASHYGISSEGAHRALNDCRMNQKVFEYLSKEPPKQTSKEEEDKFCPKCGNSLKVRNGIYGKFWGCSSYPECKYTHNYDRTIL